VREEQLLAKRAAKLADLREVRDKALAVQRQLDARVAEARAVSQRRQEVVSEFDNLVTLDDPFREALSKVFFRWAGGGVPLCWWWWCATAAGQASHSLPSIPGR
jgi:hypothetical protein